MGTERFGDLHGECAYAPGCAVDEDALARLNFALIAKPLQRGYAGDGRACSVFPGEIVRFKARLDSGAHAYSANDPEAMPKTASPGLKTLTLGRSLPQLLRRLRRAGEIWARVCR